MVKAFVVLTQFFTKDDCFLHCRAGGPYQLRPPFHLTAPGNANTVVTTVLTSKGELCLLIT